MTDKSLLPVAQRPLPGGSVLYHIETAPLPLALLQVVVRTGSIHEGADAGCGVSHFLEHMLFQGSARYPEGAVGSRVHTLGGDCNAYTAFDHTAYFIEVPVEKIDDAADILSSMVAEPLFPQAKFQSEKTVIAREADMIFDRPEQVLMQNLWQQVFTAHPARLPIVGYPDKIAEVDRERMANYYRRRYGAARTYWLVAGAVDVDKIQALLAEKLAGFTRGDLSEPVIPIEPEQQFERRTEAVWQDPMARLALGIRTPAASDKIIPALDILTGVLGQNDSSRLVRKLWQERELAVSLSSAGYAASFGGVIGVSAACEPGKLAALESGVREILDEVRTHGITEAELAREKLQQRMHFYRSTESMREKMNIVNDGILNYGVPDFAEHYLARLDAVTLDEVSAAARDYLDPRRFSWSVLSPKAPKTQVAVTAKSALSEVVSGKLTCGAEYAIVRRGAIPLDELSVLLPAGAVWESGSDAPISAMLCEMLTSGSADMPESNFYELLDSHGMDLDVSCGRNTLSIALSFPADERALAEKILGNLLKQPRFDEAVFVREKGNLAEQLASRMMNPSAAALVTARKALYGKHPAGRDQLGTAEALETVTLEAVQAYYATRFDPAWVKFGGTAATPAAEKRLKNGFEKLAAKMPWSKTKLVAPGAPDAQIVPDLTPIRVELPREQSAVIVAIRGCRAEAREHHAVDILDQALNGMASRLFTEVREKRSLAYTTGASLNYGLAPGMIALYAGVAPERALEAAACLQDEIVRIRENGLDKAEFEAARLGAISALSRRLEDTDARLLSVLLSLFYHEAPECGLNSPERLAKVRYADCNRMLKKLFAASEPVAVIAGPAVKAAKAKAPKKDSKVHTSEQLELPLGHHNSGKTKQKDN